MVRSRRAFLGSATAVTTLALAGCTSDSRQTTATSTTETAGTDVIDTTNETVGGGAVIQVYDHEELGEILVDAQRTALYMFTADPQPPKKSTCYDGCANTWPPLVATAVTKESEVTAKLSKFERETGESHVQANDWPLYYYEKDHEPGEPKGQGKRAFGGRWWVLRPDGTPVKKTPSETTHTTTTDGTTTDGTTSGG